MLSFILEPVVALDGLLGVWSEEEVEGERQNILKEYPLADEHGDGWQSKRDLSHFPRDFDLELAIARQIGRQSC